MYSLDEYLTQNNVVIVTKCVTYAQDTLFSCLSARTNYWIKFKIIIMIVLIEQDLLEREMETIFSTSLSIFHSFLNRKSSVLHVLFFGLLLFRVD
jgi:hypothetical protein